MNHHSSTNRPNAGSLFQPQKHPHPHQFRFQRLVECHLAAAGHRRNAVADRSTSVGHRQIAPADHAVAPQQRQRVVAELALGARACRPRSDRPSPRTARSGGGPTPPGRTAPAGAPRRRACSAGSSGALVGRPVPVDAVHARCARRCFARASAGLQRRRATAARRSAGSRPAGPGWRRAAARTCAPTRSTSASSQRARRWRHRAAGARASCAA